MCFKYSFCILSFLKRLYFIKEGRVLCRETTRPFFIMVTAYSTFICNGYFRLNAKECRYSVQLSMDWISALLHPDPQ